MFAKEYTSLWKDTLHAKIINSNNMLKEIRCYNWNAEDLVVNIGMLKAVGYSNEQCLQIEAKWNRCQKEMEGDR